MKTRIQLGSLLGLFTFLMVLSFASCEKQDDLNELEVQEDPENDPLNGDADLLIATIQNDFLTVIEGFNELDMPFTRQIYMFNEYFASDYTNSPLDQKIGLSWEKTYDILHNTQIIDEINSSSEVIVPQHLGMAEVLQAFAMMLLVDHHGDVPYTQALDPDNFPNPETDTGQNVYEAQLLVLDSAISHLNETAPVVPEDLYNTSGFDKDRWVALANTLKLRAYLNMRLINPTMAAQGIETILNENLIDAENKDFQFSYNSSDQKNPFYIQGYGSDWPRSYMSNSLFDVLNAGDANIPFVEDGIADPRLRYYLYRQIYREPIEPHFVLLPCTRATNIQYDYCHVGNSYWGRDHSNSEGIPPDSDFRATYGLYPMGGTFDRDLFVRTNVVVEGLEGAGIFPIHMSFFTQFMLAEASLTLSVGLSPEFYLEQGIRMSMDKVSNFAASQDVGGFGMTATEIDDYVLRALAEFAVASNEERLHLIEREFYLSSFGNGMETYNMYRRTGYPITQSPVNPAGPFPRVLPYAASVVAGNPTISQHDVTVQTFWDNNPPGFID